MSKKEIKILLIKNDVKQVDIARKLNVSKTAIHNVIRGISTSRRIKKAISEAVGKPISELWPNDEDEDRRAA